MIPALLLALVGLVALALVARPLFSPAPAANPDAEGRRADLDEEYRAHLAALRDLQDAEARGEADPEAAARERARLQNRAARALAALDALPPAPPAAPRPARAPGALALLGAALVVAVGAFTFLPDWQLAGTSPAEARTLKAALSLPSLERAAKGGNPEARLAFARAAFDAGRFRVAARAYTDVLLKNPRDPEALRRVGAVLLQDDARAQEAAALISTSASLDPKNDEGQLFLGFALARFGDSAGALAALERYRSLNPQGRDADDLIAELRAQAGKGDRGATVYARNCATCHGTEGRGGVGPSLRGVDAAAARTVIRGGAAGMPAYDERELPEADLAALLRHLAGWKAE